MQKRYDFMNVLRALSMIAIVFYHMVFTLYLYGIRQLDSIRFLFENANMHIAKVGVCLFFMLSGAGLMLSESNTSKSGAFSIKSFYKKRFIKILVPFYIVYLCYFAFLLITGNISLNNPFAGKELKPWSFLYTILGMDGYADSFGIATCSIGIGEWFLGCLIIIYILYPLLRKAMNKNRYVTMAIATVYFILICIFYDKLGYISKVPMYTNLALKIYDFILGMFLATIIDKLPKWTLFLGILVNIFFAACPVTLPGINSFQIPLQCLAIFILFAGLENVFAKASKPMKIVGIICAYSYEYFLIHHAVILHLTKQGINTAFGNVQVLILFVEEILLTAALSFILKSMQSFVAKKLYQK